MKKIAISTVKNFIKDHNKSGVLKRVYTIGDGEFEVELNNNPTIEERSAAVRRVMSACFDSRGDYRPEYFDPMVNATVLQMFTNLPVLSKKSDVEGEEALLDIDAMNNLYQAMTEDDQWNELDSFKWEIHYLCEMTAVYQKERMLDQLNTQNLRETDAFGKAMQSLANLLDKIGELVDGVNMDELMEYAKKLSSATEGLDEGGIVKELVRMHHNEEI